MATRPARAAAVRPPLIGLGRVFVIPECPSPRKAHPHHESNEESPESRRLFGAGLGARSPQRTPRGKHGKAKRLTQKRTYAAPPSPFSAFLRSPSGSPQRNAQARSELTKPDNCTAFENVLTAIPTYGGTGTQHIASRSVWRYAANSRRDLNARHSDRNARRS